MRGAVIIVAALAVLSCVTEASPNVCASAPASPYEALKQAWQAQMQRSHRDMFDPDEEAARSELLDTILGEVRAIKLAQYRLAAMAKPRFGKRSEEYLKCAKSELQQT